MNGVILMSKIGLRFLSLLAVLVVGAVASAPASAVMPAFTNEAGSLITGKLEVLTKKVGGNAILKTTIAGVKMEILCTEEHGTGWIENSASTGTGVGLALLHYLKCTFTKPPGKGCKVENELIHVQLVHSLLLLGGSTGYLVDFYSDTGSIFTELSINGCENTSLDGQYPVAGYARAIANNINLTLEFDTESGSELTFAGNPATYTDIIKVEMAGGGGIMIENGV
jgi:hypothetical protein